MKTNAVQFFDDGELPEFLTRREKRLQKKIKKTQFKTNPKETAFSPRTININRINPLTENQAKTFEAFDANKHLLLHGMAGTGKTFVALYLTLKCVIYGKAAKPIVILRSVVPSRDMGFLPGKMEEKISVYEEPYRHLCAELTGHATAYEFLKDHGYIQFSTTSYLRGLTFHDNTIIVDEAQNCSGHELDTIITRVGDGCRIIFCADFSQTDLKYDERKGFTSFMKILKNMSSFEHVEFTNEDIVRGPLVKEYITTKEQLGISLM